MTSPRRPDREKSQIVLIGASAYQDERLPELSAVRRSITALREVLAGPEFGIVDPGNCTVILDERSQSAIGHELVERSQQAEDLLLVYYCGHGLTGGRDNRLYLGLYDSDWDHPQFSSLDYESVRGVVLDSPAQNKVIVIDCCFSGRAIADFMAMPATFVEQLAVDGTFVLTSATRSAVSVILRGEGMTAFTGRLCDILRSPARDEKSLTLDSIYVALRSRMVSEGLPEPQRRNSGTAGSIVLSRRASQLDQSPEANSSRDQSWSYIVGEPGRAPSVVLPQRDQEHPDQPDIVIDSVALGHQVTVRAASVRGLSHYYSGVVRQDAYALQVSSDGNWVAVAVADGASTSKLSHIGAHVAASSTVSDLCRLLDAGEDLNWQRIFSRTSRQMLAVARDRAVWWPGDDSAWKTREMLASSLVAAAIPLNATVADQIRLAVVGDTSAWLLEAPGRRLMMITLPDRDDQFETLPAQFSRFDFVEIDLARPVGGALFLLTDGITDALDDSGELGEFLAEQWSHPPHRLAFAAQVDYICKSFDDDRTAVGIWFGR